MVAAQLIAKYPIISDQINKQELLVILTELEQLLARGGSGAVVEFGCYVGTTSLFVTQLLSQFNSSVPYHVFDSFAGLPAKLPQDYSPAGEQFKTGELLATKAQFIAHFKKAGLPLPVIHKAWFSDLSPADVPSDIQFAFLDGDYYESIKTSLALITPKLVPGAVIIVDDYQNEALPGAAKAVDEWLRAHPAKLTVRASLAIIRPQL